MQRLYSMFPGGRAGAGLLALRLFLAMNLWPPFAHGAWALPAPWRIGAGALALALLGGIATPLAALLACLAPALALCQGRPETGAALLAVLPPLALALLGPGAYSLDARCFGRRLLVLPRDRPRPPR
ncbi:hypothetical protein JR065_00660 [Xanthomonas sp. AmX2]|uniref:hypothetical protein n=1 Tax=Xanthomonas sp. TaxID=29446 RepID=UPI00197ECDBA|nr:hypothetical protein [Xanthomonas sp.]MBN6148837.1 hypothetical protein [Xanthomonas sp.]